MKSPLTKLVMDFLEYSLEFLCRFNTVFQSSLAMLPSLKVEVLRLLRILLGKFSFNDNVFDDVTVLLPENRSNLSCAAVIRLAKRFSTAAPPDIYDALEEEVLDYKLSPPSDFPDIDKEGKE